MNHCKQLEQGFDDKPLDFKVSKQIPNPIGFYPTPTSQLPQ